MKRYLGFLFLCLLFFLIDVYPQEKQLFGFGPIDWGSSKDQVKGIMKEKFNLLPGYEKEDAVGFEGGKYFGEDIHIWVFFFDVDKLNEADLVVQNIDRPSEAIFYEVVHNISDDYGDPDLFKADDRTAEWFYYDLSGKKLSGTIKVSPYSSDKMTSIKITFLKI
jgi:hypothetical protein